MAMIKYLLAVLAVASLTVAMVPREKRATEEVESPTAAMAVPESTTEKIIYCHKETPCGWTLYAPFTKRPELELKNDYCSCAPGLECLIYEDEVTRLRYVLRCMVSKPATALDDQAF